VISGSENGGLYLGKALSGSLDPAVELEEYRRMAAVEDQMWFYRALRAHIERELLAGLATAPRPKDSLQDSGDSEGKFRALVAPMREILDAGCGTGGLMRHLEKRHEDWRWTGVDVEPLACELAASRCHSRVVTGSLAALPFADGSFDAVVCSDVLYHLDDDVAALREIHRVMRPEGVVVVNVPAHPWLWSYHDVTVHGRRRYERAGLKRLLDSAGFAAEQLTHWNALALPLVVIRRKCLPPPRTGSDVRLYPGPVEALFFAGTQLENTWLRSFGPLPFGSSLLARARKRRGS
jgi:SAM-dependent methyltransferase